MIPMKEIWARLTSMTIDRSVEDFAEELTSETEILASMTEIEKRLYAIEIQRSNAQRDIFALESDIATKQSELRIKIADLRGIDSMYREVKAAKDYEPLYARLRQAGAAA